jgi:rhamnogalacturonan endolyase
MRITSILPLLPCLAGTSLAVFGVTSSSGYYVVDTNGGLVFKVSQSTGDIVSLVYNSFEAQDSSKFSQVSSGLGSDDVVATTVSSDIIKITVTTDTLVHYYIAKVRHFLMACSSGY